MIQDILPHVYDVSYRNKIAEANDVLLVYTSQGLLLRQGELNTVTFPKISEVEEHVPNLKDKAVYLFRIDSTDYYCLIDGEIGEFASFTFLSRDKIRAIRPVWHCFIATLGLHLHNWYTNTLYCGRCGTKNEIYNKERAMICSKCGRISYPQICPCVIVGIINKDKLLLTRYSQTRGRYRKYALVAGYAEIGETLEDTVRREVQEEVGLKVKNIKYFKSQPWALTGTLLVGYFCEVEGEDNITVDTVELSEAAWFTREDIPQECADPTISLTGTMIDVFKRGLI